MIKSLRSYTGAILLVSHDRHLIQTVIEGAPLLPDGEGSDTDSDEEISEDQNGQCANGVVYKVGPKGRVRELPGGVDDVSSRSV